MILPRQTGASSLLPGRLRAGRARKVPKLLWSGQGAARGLRLWWRKGPAGPAKRGATATPGLARPRRWVRLPQHRTGGGGGLRGPPAQPAGARPEQAAAPAAPLPDGAERRPAAAFAPHLLLPGPGWAARPRFRPGASGAGSRHGPAHSALPHRRRGRAASARTPAPAAPAGPPSRPCAAPTANHGAPAPPLRSAIGEERRQSPADSGVSSAALV